MEEKQEEGESTLIGRILREELVWAERIHEENSMDSWVDGFRTALRTVLKEVNRIPLEEVSK